MTENGRGQRQRFRGSGAAAAAPSPGRAAQAQAHAQAQPQAQARSAGPLEPADTLDPPPDTAGGTGSPDTADDAAPPPRPSTGRVYGARRPGPLGALKARLPRPRLTALGGGVLSTLLTVIVGGLDELLLDGSGPVYGVFFLLISAVCALWVRPADVFTSAVSVPLAFTIGLLLISDGGGSFGSHVMALFSALSSNAVWLYGGTLLALLIATMRKAALLWQQRGQ
ncbi:hypothetical protein GCM10027091_38790 [Streptomyces daliensis]